MSEPEQRHQDQPQRKFTKAEAKLVAFGVLALLAGVFVGQNTGQVRVHFVFVSANIRLIWVFLLCILIGVSLDRLLTRRGVLPPSKNKRER
ncbi:MAG TPA: hypothetical protein VM841_03415 [Actinomycetota bacterium]|nr:hypothetical protein [Actinomycetota bacterium]